MGQKKIPGRHHILRAFYSFRRLFDNIPFRYIDKTASPLFSLAKHKTSAGFTLIELVVAVGILGTLVVALILIVQPQKQLSKAWDAQRQSDISKIRTAADIYYDNNNCYPLVGEIPFGSEWKDESSGTVYMSKVPQDPENSRDSGKAYIYQSETQGCPQWNVIYGKLTYSNSSRISCPLGELLDCLPQGYVNSGYNYCVVSGTVDCSIISSSTFTGLPSQNQSGQSSPTPATTPAPTQRSNPTTTPSPTPRPSVTPTPSPTPAQCTPPNSTLCNNICVNTQIDFSHCGQCGNSCSSGQTCTNGVCRDAECPLNYSCTSKSQQNPQGTCNSVPDGTGKYCSANCGGACR